MFVGPWVKIHLHILYGAKLAAHLLQVLQVNVVIEVGKSDFLLRPCTNIVGVILLIIRIKNTKTLL